MSSFKSEAPIIGIIANSTSMANRDDLIAELGEPRDGFFNPLKFSFKELSGEIIALDIQPNEILEKAGMARAKVALFKAVDFLAERGVKVICFTASTKRLPGKTGSEIKKLYPDITFSIGDSATMVSYLALLDHYLLPGQIDRTRSEIVCLGAGFLGVKSVEHLLRRGCKRVTLISEQGENGFPKDLRVLDSLDKMPKGVKLFLSCSHKYQINPASFRKFLSPQAVILDVAVPPGINREVFEALPASISRFDGGDFFLEDIRYDFPSKILSFPQVGFWYGCFAEAVILAVARQAGIDLKKFNFFQVNQENCDFLAYYLRQEKVSVPLINFFAPDKIAFIPF